MRRWPRLVPPVVVGCCAGLATGATMVTASSASDRMPRVESVRDIAATRWLKLQTLTLQRLVRHRGPDGSGIHCIDNGDGTSSSIAHERLAIMDPLSGNQPLFSKDGKLSLAVNGEIYNCTPPPRGPSLRSSPRTCAADGARASGPEQTSTCARA